MDFEINREDLWELYNELSTAASNVESNIGLIYQGIDAMNEAWSGPSYDDFKLKAESYRKYLDALRENYNVWGKIVVDKLLSGVVQDLSDKIQEAYDALGGEG